MSQILEHLKDPVKLLKRIKCNKIIIGVPSIEYWQKMIQKDLDMDYHTDKSHYREYTRKLLEEQLTEAGFKIEYMNFSNLQSINCIAKRKNDENY